MPNALKTAWTKLQRDLGRDAGVRQVATKGVRYAWELATARLWLRDVDEVGTGVRTFFKPRIDNLGFMSLGAHTLLRSVNVPVELTTAPGARLEIGAECSINYGVSIGCTAHIRIGNRTRLGPYVMIVDNGFHEIYDRSRRPESQPVTIEEDVWIGAKASVLPGVTIGRGSVVGTSAVVTKDVPPFSVVAGIPAQIVKELDPSKFMINGRRLDEVGR